MKTLQQHLDEWDQEERLGDPRFMFKHAIRWQGLFLYNDGEIYDSNGRLYGTLGEVKWRNDHVIDAEVKLAGNVDFVLATVDIGKLK